MEASTSAGGLPGGWKVMFANQKRGVVGLGSIVAVAAIMVGSIVGTGVMVKSYREGGASSLPAGTSCQVICHGQVKAKG